MSRDQPDFQFGPFVLSVPGRRLTRDGSQIALTPKAFDTLMALVTRRGAVVEKQELMKVIWGDVFVDESTLTQNIFTIRKALGEGTWIETVPKRGYRMSVPVREVEPAGSPDAPSQPGSTLPGSDRKRTIWLAGSFVVGVLLCGAFWLGGAFRQPTHKAPIHSVAVMPFIKLSGEGQDYIADAVTDSLIANLAQIHSLQIFARTATIRYRKSSKSITEITRELAADAIVEGTVQAMGGRIHVTAHLVRGSTGMEVWARDYEFDLYEVFNGEGARTIAAGIQAEVTPTEIQRLSRTRKIAPSAQQLYLQGRDNEERRDENNLAQSIEWYEQAIGIQPDFAEAHAALARSWVERGVWGTVGFRAAEAPARRAALRALELDPDLAEAHAVLGHIFAFYDWAWSSSEHEFHRALDLDPNSVYAHRLYGQVLEGLGRSSEAITELRRALALDPASSVLEGEYARALYRARRAEESIRHFRHAIELNPIDQGLYTRLAEVYETTGQFELAEKSLYTVGQMRHENPERSPRFAALYAWRGQSDRARRILRALELPDVQARPSIDLALAYLKLGNRDRGYYWLGKLFDERGLVNYIQFDPRFDIVRGDPRFRSIVGRLNVPDPS